MTPSHQRLINWMRLIGFLGFMLGLTIAVYEISFGHFTKADVAPVTALILGGAIAFIGGDYLPRVLKP